MAQDSKIEWTDATFNPWWGCDKISPACAHCYAADLAHRYKHDVWGKDAPRRFFGDKHWAEPVKWNKIAEREGRRIRVFCGSMCDVMEWRDDLSSARIRLYDLIEATPNLDWQLLSKRPENYRTLLPSWWTNKPLPNVWLGTTAENQRYADERIPHLLATPAAIRFVSAEPLLGPIDFHLQDRWCHQTEPAHDCDNIANHLHWCIVGGESGPGARPMHPDWARSIRDQCVAAGVAFFFKQWGQFVWRETWGDSTGGPKHVFEDGVFVESVGKKKAGRMLDGREWNEMPEAKP